WNGDNQQSQPGARKVQWEAQIRRKGYPDQRKTFETKSDAQAWARMIEHDRKRNRPGHLCLSRRG
ncbi:shufflon-specific recombinase, partial [Pseudomonas syringae pv. actinidiae ICMP 19096]